MTNAGRALTFATLSTFATVLAADMQVIFTESAPKDRFSFTNTGNCVLEDVNITIDLTQTAGKLIFDTTSQGAGVEVYQPFEVSAAGNLVLSSGEVIDGDSQLSVSIPSIQPGKSVGFTIDVDDTMVNSSLGKIRVAGSEIQNGTASIAIGNNPIAFGVFSDNSEAVVKLPSC